jgi:membrane-associated protease RseP (regulator of RpoE activity)
MLRDSLHSFPCLFSRLPVLFVGPIAKMAFNVLRPGLLILMLAVMGGVHYVRMHWRCSRKRPSADPIVGESPVFFTSFAPVCSAAFVALLRIR